MRRQFEDQGYVCLPASQRSKAWAAAALDIGAKITKDPGLREQWLRHGQTWFVGVDVLPNESTGQIGGVPLPPEIPNVLEALGLPMVPLHAAQLSVTYPGYPQQDTAESNANHRYRQNRDAAHVDGLLPIGPARRRVLAEPHAYVLGIGVNTADTHASPLVVWPESHRVMTPVFANVLTAETWQACDLTSPYQAARKRVFATLPRVEVPLAQGEIVILHRHLLHGVAPWAEGAKAPKEGRMTAYFRPQYPAPTDWFTRP